MKALLTMLVSLAIIGCASQSAGLTEAASNIQIFYEEPQIEYESIESFDTTSRGKDAMGALERTLNRAAELGAEGLIVHSIENKGQVAGQGDNFGTGGGAVFVVYQIRSTAIRYLEGPPAGNAGTGPNP